VKILINLDALEEMRRRMGAPEVQWTGAVLLPRDIPSAIYGPGIEVKIDEVVPKGNVLTWRGEVVLLYIKDTQNDLDQLLRAPDGNGVKRFHISDCRALERMKNEGRFERYVVTKNTSGRFRCIPMDRLTREKGAEVEAGLMVCKDCLSRLNYDGYFSEPRPQKENIWRAFSIEKFLSEFSPSFVDRPTETDDSQPVQVYSDDWEEISKKYRERMNWECEGCGIRLSEKSNRRLLHVHHKNRVVSDNSLSNLIALCIVCHADEPGHSMHIKREDKKVINSLRWRQRRR
jgi:hypothetical protein